MKKSLLILILFITSCGYQPIYLNQDIKKLEFSKITLEGEKDINRKMVGSLPYRENKSKDSLSELLLQPILKNMLILPLNMDLKFLFFVPPKFLVISQQISNSLSMQLSGFAKMRALLLNILSIYALQPL